MKATPNRISPLDAALLRLSHAWHRFRVTPRRERTEAHEEEITRLVRELVESRKTDNA